ncbi:MAG: hypothetical protein OEQ47_16475 [Acidimicrobiia bacterium]|nr:hypothetical protein [Acidimicrobiia bacterium]
MRPELIMLDEKRDGEVASVSVVLIRDDQEFRGEATGPADASKQLDLICQATLNAARNASDKALDLEFAGLAITDVHSKPVAMALVRVQGGENVFVGTASVRGDGVSKAVSRAIMDAVNRPLFG